MGNSTSTPDESRALSPTQRQFILPQYGGKVQVDKERNSIVKILSVPIEEDSQFLKMVVPRLNLRHPNLAEFKKIEELAIEDGPLCAPTNKQYRLQYQLLTFSLFHQIQRYCKLRQPFSEGQICRIFESVVLCLDYLHKNKTMHGDIKVSTIFMDKNRNIKLMDSFMLKMGKTNYEVVLQDPKSMSLLSPEQLDLLRIKLFDSLEGGQKNEMFMVGLTMLQVATIREGMKGYNLDTLTINEGFFINAMRDLQDCGYSYELSNLIMNCVHKIPNNRPTFGQFLNQISLVKQNLAARNYIPKR